ncbi:MAG: M48 family metallopeptidase [Nocardiopsaceae bacterium]|nr:M48 family metallopeptidase [Nocardiopsaceae bacterium]
MDRAGYARALASAGLPEELPWRVTVSSRRRTIGLTAEPGGSLTIRIPEGMPSDQVVQAVTRRLPWIARATRRNAETAAAHATKELIDGENFPFLGRNRQLVLSARAGVRLDGDRLLAPVHVTAADIIGWYAAAGSDWLAERAPQYCSRLGVPPPALGVRDLGRRWGTCAPGASPRLVLHWAVFQLSAQLIDVVIVHEVAHLVHPKHGGAFERLVGQVFPDYRDRLTELTEQGRRVWMGDVRPADGRNGLHSAS